MGLLTTLCHHRWSVPVLAEMGAARAGARVVALKHAVGASRESLTHALSALQALGLIARNPGYGHPLRPEYVLTGPGRTVAPCCETYRQAVVAAGAERVGFRKWTAPVLVAVARGQHRFNAIRSALGGVTPRALTTALRSMDGARLILRRIDDGYPPRAEYFLSPNGKRLAGAACALADALMALDVDDRRARGSS